MNDQDKILELSIENSHYFNLIAILQAENSKLRECVTLMAGDQEFYCAVGDHNKQSLARQVLKELDNNQLNDTK